MPSETSLDLSDSVNRIAKAHGAKVLSDNIHAVAGWPGREFEAKTLKTKGYVSGRVISVGGRYYAIMAVGDKARLSNPEVHSYLQSFRLIR